MRKTLILQVLIAFSLPSFSQWTNDFDNPLIIDECRIHIDPEVVFSDGYFTFTWAENTSNPSKKRKISIFDYKGYAINYNDNPFSTEDFQVINNSVTWRNFWPAVGSGSFLTQLMRKKNTNKYYVTVLRIDKDGNTQWSIRDDLFRQNFSAKYFSLCASENDEAFLSVQWDNITENKTDLSIYKISSDGVVEWGHNKLFFEDSTVGINRDISILPSNSGGCFVSYRYVNQVATESGYSYVDSYNFIHKLDSDGQSEWDEPYILDYQPGGIKPAGIVKDQDDNLYCLWESGQYRIQKVHPDGYSLWTEGGEVLIDRYNLRETLFFEWGDNDEIRAVLSAYEDSRWKIYGQSFTRDGQLNWGAKGASLIDVPTSLFGGNFAVASSNDTILIAYNTINDSDPILYNTEYQLFDVNGFGVLPEPAIVYSHEGLSNYICDVTSGEEGQFLLSWFSFNNSRSLLEAQSITTDGSPGVLTSINNPFLIEDRSFIGYNHMTRELFFAPGIEECQFYLTSMSGQVMKSGIIKDRISVQNISFGIYVISVFQNNHLIHSYKLLINSL